MSLTTEEPVLAHDVAVRLGNEMPLHAMGESVAASALAAQRGIARQQCDGPVYILDELELALPVRVRIDPFGQVIVSVADPTPYIPFAGGQLRLHVRLGTPGEAPEATSAQPLAEIGLSPEDVAAFERQHVFTVDDLLRIGRDAAGVRAMEQLGAHMPVWSLLGRAMLLSLGAPRILFDLDICTPERLLAADAVELAARLSEKSGTPWLVERVREWQDRVRRSGCA